MSLPAAAAPVAILVLAWDAATPAVRALVEAPVAEPLLASVLVIVPADPANEQVPMLEEFFPIAPLPELPATLPSPAPEPALPLQSAATSLLAPASAATLPLPLATGLPTRPLAGLTAPAELVRVGALSLAAPQRPTPEAVVRVLHLSSFSLPALAALAGQALPRPTWAGKAARPAAPYLGSAAVALADENASPQIQTTANQLSISSEQGTLLAAAISPLPPAPATEPPVAEAARALLRYLPDELPALDREADAAPLPSEEAGLPGAETPWATEFAAALASLREPLALEEPALSGPEHEATYYANGVGAGEEFQAPPARPVAPALRPASQAFGAPNLNFQVIQYARFAVPVALAEAPFTAIYAPAWPTWLAAQELRQRTGRPLVLHVSTLAANEGESVETATGWQAELQRQALHRADLILTETFALAHRLRQDLGLPPERVRPVPAADAAAIAQALHTAQPRPTVSAG